jgi:hypothetical protein
MDGIRVRPMPPPPGLLDSLSNMQRQVQDEPVVRAPPSVNKTRPPPPAVLQHMRNREIEGDPEAWSEEEEEGMSSEEEESDEESDEDEEDMSPEQMAQQSMLARIIKIKTLHRMTGPVVSRNTDVDTVRSEMNRLEDEVVLRQSIKMQRRVLMAIASGIEFVHFKTPVTGKLSGWSELLMANIDSYDDVFDRLHRKHAPTLGFGKGKRTEPEIELAMMVGYSAFSFAVTTTMLKMGTPTAPPAARDTPFSMTDYKQRKSEMGFAKEEAKLTATPNTSGATAAMLAYNAGSTNTRAPAKKPHVVTFGT